jgi:CBS domain-containing protein
MNTTKIKDLMTREIVSVDINDSVDTITHVMKEQGVGSVLVYDANDFVGLITKRDLLERVLLDCINPCTIIAKNIVTKNPITVSGEDYIPECLRLMYKHKIKRLPVEDPSSKKMVGIITSYDIISAFNALGLS